MKRLSDAAVLRIAFMFPSLTNADGLSPWNPVQFDAWANDLGRSRNEVESARFLLSIWNDEFDWDCGTFESQTAIRHWDRAHRRAFLELVCQDLSLAS